MIRSWLSLSVRMLTYIYDVMDDKHPATVLWSVLIRNIGIVNATLDVFITGRIVLSV